MKVGARICGDSSKRLLRYRQTTRQSEETQLRIEEMMQCVGSCLLSFLSCDLKEDSESFLSFFQGSSDKQLFRACRCHPSASNLVEEAPPLPLKPKGPAVSSDESRCTVTGSKCQTAAPVKPTGAAQD